MGLTRSEKQRSRKARKNIMCKAVCEQPTGSQSNRIKNNLEGKQPGEQGDCIFVPVIVFYLNCMERQNSDML